MIVGEAVTSVFGGPGDRAAYGEYEMGGVSTQPGRKSEFSPTEKKIFACYSRIRDLRKNESGNLNTERSAVAEDILQNYSREWLLNLEVLELSLQKERDLEIEKLALKNLKDPMTTDVEVIKMIAKGILIADTLD